jgi:hypothetical protein
MDHFLTRETDGLSLGLGPPLRRLIARRPAWKPRWRRMGLNQLNCALSIVKVSSAEPTAVISFNDVGQLQVDR